MSRQSRTVSMLLTRPRPQAERFVSELPQTLRARLDPVFAPLLDIVTLRKVDLAGFRGVVLTSENAMPSLAPGGGLAAYCVGPRTTVVANAHGFAGQDCGGCAEKLVGTLIEQQVATPLIHPHGVHNRGNVAARLTDAGLPCAGIEVYDQRAMDLPDGLRDTLGSGQPMLVPLFSPRTARLFAANCPRAPGAEALCLSLAVAQELEKNRYRCVTICTAPNARAMIEAINCRVLEGSIETGGQPF